MVKLEMNPLASGLQNSQGVISMEDIFFSRCPKMEGIRNIINEIAPTDITVLIEGETGTGKEFAAQSIHQKSQRKDQPFIKVNCAAIPSTLLESECFGFEKGAFTGAHLKKPGKFELANGGTILLNDIAEMDISIQGKLLQILQDGRFSRLGGEAEVSVDTRVISTTNEPLEKSMETGRFREDLYYRLNAMSIALPPLRDRREQIAPLAHYFFELHRAKFEKQIPRLSPRLVKLLERYDWPGNIRELDNLIKRVVLFGEKEIFLDLSSLRKQREMGFPEADKEGKDESPLLNLKEVKKEAAERTERKLILQTLGETRWNRREAAKLLRISYKTLLYKIQRYQGDGEKTP
jgi:two-component system response regulator AtoC